MPSLRTDKGNKWLARAIVHGKQIACKLFPAGKKYGQSWRQAKAWEDAQKAVALQTFEDEQREISLKSFQNDQKAFVLKSWKAGKEAIALKNLEEDQKADNLKQLHKAQAIEFLKRQEEEQKNLAEKLFEAEQEALIIKQIEAEQKALSEQELSIEVQKEVEISIQDEVKQPIVQKNSYKQLNTAKMDTLTKWGEKYLEHVKRTMSHKTLVEKQTVMRNFYNFCEDDDVQSIDSITPAKAYDFLSEINDEKGGNVANKYRKNILAAWAWGSDFIDDFPQGISPFYKVRPFAKEHHDRYVPPEEDVIKVLQQATGQDLILLLTLYFTGARRGEIFKLQWQDVNLDEEKIRLSDNKAGNGQKRVRWLQMHPELVRALTWWKKERPCDVDNVFMQTHCESSMGKPFTQRMRFMRNLCEKAGVKEFGFHAIRHKCASITFAESGLNDAQILMGHYRATTTDIYTKSAGLYTKQDGILSALGGSRIGQMVGNLLDFTDGQECYS